MNNPTNTSEISANVIFASSFGTILEWYDFSLYAYLAPTFSSLFFPNHIPVVSLMLTYLVFSVGFLVRPLGAILFGHFGDTVGRKKVLVISMMLMAILTCCMGLLPTYQNVGLLAPSLLIALRLLQGLVVGGESIGAGSFVIESVPSEKRGIAAALVWSGSGVGILLSSVIITMTAILLNHSAVSSYAWRVPFLLGAFTGFFGVYFRRKMIESPYFTKLVEKRDILKMPMIHACRFYSTKILMAMGLYALCAMTTYLIFVFMPVYVTKNIGLSFKEVMIVNTMTMSLMILLSPIMGRMADLKGRKIFLRVGAIGFLVLGYPLYLLIAQGALIDLVIAQIIFAILTACIQGTILSATLELFPANIRYSATAIGLNLSYSIFGGTAPIVAMFLMTKLGTTAAPGICLVFGAVLALLALAKMPETHREQLT